MFELFQSAGAHAKGLVEALDKSLAVIEFAPDGRIIRANANFCAAVGYDLAAIVGKHHRIFVEPSYAETAEYRAFWEKLGRGDFDSGLYKRRGASGRELWIQATYNPIRNVRDVVIRIVKIATVVTDEQLKTAEMVGKLDALSRVQAVIDFNPNGEVITANANFLNVLGYSLEEIIGRHHRMFVEPTYAQSAEYREFWAKLNRGEHVSAEFKRFGKGGKAVWIQASYNPIFDMNRKVIKITKFASDVTERVRAVEEIAAGLARLADNDLEHRIERTFAPDFEKLRLDYNSSLDKLRITLQQIFERTSAIQSGTQEIARATDDLSRRTEQQAASLEETAAALSEITSTVKIAADGAHNSRQIVSKADDDAKKGATVVEQTVTAMSSIATSSQAINQIIGVIDEIAFQTNLLALNAGVEAARAGDAGRGFAVVASEVRALAQRSAEAAKEIKNLISTSTNQVSQGVNLVAQTGQSLERIIAQVSEINAIVGGIATGAKEQSAALQEVNTAIKQMDQMTQQNAAMVEETTAASHSLSDETVSLVDLINQFKIGRSALDRVGQNVVPLASRSAPRRRPVAAVGAKGSHALSGESWEEF